MHVGQLAVRTTVGTLFVGHGTQKLFGWFGGHGIEGTGGFFESLGLYPGRRMARAAGISEAVGGALLALGLATPLAATSLMSVMITAVRKVHWKNGPWAGDGGYEYNLMLLAALFAVMEEGPGRWSLDAALGRDRKGLGWAVGTLAAAVAGSELTIRDGERRAPPGPGEAAAEDRALPQPG